MGTSTANGFRDAHAAVTTRLTANEPYSARRGAPATSPCARKRLPTAMSSPWLLRATATANAQTQTPSPTANSPRQMPAETASPVVPPKAATAPPTKTRFAIHDAATIRRPGATAGGTTAGYAFALTAPGPRTRPRRSGRALESPPVTARRWFRAAGRRLRRPKTVDWSTRPAQEAWAASIEGEVRFWRNWLETKGGKWPASFVERFDTEFPLQDEFSDLITVPDGDTVRILDVGAGPLTWVGRRSPRWPLEITAVDALGDQYRALLEEAGKVPPVWTQTCESEHVADRFAPGSFDVVTARNTLDHSYDPVLAISQMLTVAKPGAALLLVHHRNTAVDENYHGMHQWNFEAADGTLVIWRPGRRHDLREALGDRCAVERSWIDGTWEYVVIRKSLVPAP